MHTGSAASSNLMATEQCFYALVAAKRLENNQNAFFDMSDCINIDDNEKTFGLPGKNSKIVLQEKIYKGKTFDDIKNHKNQSAIEGLSSRGIINGINDTFFCPDNSMTRAEFAAIVVKALGIPLSDMSDFADVSESDWFYSYVGTAFDYGIVNGISESLFNPGGTITREEAAVMVTRAAKLCGMNTDMELFAAKNILAEFVDYIKVSEWAVKSVAFCYEKDILDRNQIKINSNGAITRAEVAQMIYNMLGKAELL